MKKFFSFIQFGILGALTADIIYVVIFLLIQPGNIVDIFEWIMFSILAFGWVLFIVSPILTLFIIFLTKEEGWKNNKVLLMTNVMLSIPFSFITLIAVLYFIAPR